MIVKGDIVSGTHVFRLSRWERLKVLFGWAVGVTIHMTLDPGATYSVTEVKTKIWVQRTGRAGGWWTTTKPPPLGPRR